MRHAISSLALAIALLPVAGARSADEVVLWPEHQRAFLQDGAGLLLTDEQRKKLLAMSEEEREAWIDAFLANDPVPETSENELAAAIERRAGLARSEVLSLIDDRARLLFLNGEPAERNAVECGITFKPLEIWSYPAAGDRPAARLVLYRPGPDAPYRLWLPLDSKAALYVPEMVYWLRQWEELSRRGLIRAKRFDLQACPETTKVDDATGIEALRGFRSSRPTNPEILRFVEPPADLAAWARQVTAPPATVAEALPLTELEVLFPERRNLRMVTQFRFAVPPEAAIEAAAETDDPKVILSVDGVIEQDGRVFDEFRTRFKLDPPAGDQPLPLALERALRPQRDFVVHLRVHDEVGDRRAYLSRAFSVPRDPQVVELPPIPDEAIADLEQQVAATQVSGHDSLLLVPPGEDVVLGLYRAEALVTGNRISRVKFLVDDELQLTRSQPPFTAEVRLAKFPTEQAIRAEGYDAEGELVASDEVVVNQPRGALRVRVIEPERGATTAGRITSTAEVVVPEERRVVEVRFLVNEQLVETLAKPPWRAEIDVPPGGDVAYLTVVARLDDGSRAEDVRFLNAPRYLEEVDVNLVELFTTVTDKAGRVVRGLTAADFEIREDGRPQKVGKFELVDDLPLTVGFAVDTSGSMVAALPEAQQAAVGFLENIMTPRDKVFAVSFSGKPVLLMPPTDDISAVGGMLDGLRSVGFTALHDAVVTSLYYFRSVRGRRALILLSDGDDTASAIAFRDTLEYARRSGVSVYSIGIDVGGLKLGIRKKLTELAQETGGRVYFISQAAELSSVYKEIEEELRSQYLVAYTSDLPKSDGGFRTVDVEVRGGKLRARTISGYYP